jgi:D-alanyl-D-alanine carboxypeptidase
MVLACFAAAGSASAGGDAARRSAETEALRAEVQAIVASGAPGAILLARDGSSTIRLASGYANLKSRAPLRITDRFRVGSVTKTFVAAVVLQLAGESRLALDDSVERWLPGLVPNGRAISIRRLLDMTSGLFDYLNDGDTTIERALLGGDWTHVWKPRQLVRIATSHPPRFRPGSSWSYCNTCYVLLGLIVERATGHTLAHELQRRILVPMRLNGTTFDSSPRISGRHAHGYELLGMPPLADVSILSPSAAWAAGAMVSTAGDLARFYGALLGGDLLAPDLLASMTTARRVSKDFGYGLGLARLTLPCGTAWGHDGGIPGYRAWAVSSRDGARQVVVLANLGEDSLTPKGEAAIVRALALAYCG